MTVARVATKARWTRRRDDVITLVAGLLVLIAGTVIVRRGTVSGFERAIFHAVNGLPGALYPLLWPVQQLGGLLIGPIVALVAALTRRFRLAIAALVATVAKLVLERVVKAFVSRQRPGTSIGANVHVRGKVSLSGESFVSGHVVLVTALATLVAPYLPGRWKIVPWALVGLVLFTRVYVGAHNPLDVICGAALGLVIGAALNLAFGVPAKSTA